MTLHWAKLVVIILAIISRFSIAQQPEGLTTLVTGLSQPNAVAIQPESDAIFIVESGKGRVVRLAGETLQPVITDFPLVTSNDGAEVPLGPTGLLFLSKEALLVSSRTPGDDSPLVRLYRVTDDSSPIRFEAALVTFELGPLEDPLDSPSHVVSMVASAERVFASLRSDEGPGRVIQFDRSDEESSEIRTWINMDQAMESSRPSGLTVSPHGYLVVSAMGQSGEQASSTLAFLEMSSKKVVLQLETGLQNVSSVRYSGRKQMYLLDSAWSDPEQGGLYRAIADRSAPSGMITRRIVALDHPTDMVFDSDGAVLITSWGKLDSDGGPQGALWRLASDTSL